MRRAFAAAAVLCATACGPRSDGECREAFGSARKLTERSQAAAATDRFAEIALTCDD